LETLGGNLLMYFGLTIESLNYDFSYLGGPVETDTTIPTSIVRSWDVWSPGNGQVGLLDWADLNPSPGVYDWTALKAWIATNQANNNQMVYTFGNPPAWAGEVTTNLADFQAFVTAIVTQANGAIKYWEGFNEFNAIGIAPALLVQMQEIIYNTVHTLDPGALVLSPTVSSGGAFGNFAQFLADGGGQYFDIAAYHGYLDGTGEGIAQSTIDIQNVLSEYGLSNKPLWDTEWGMEAPTVITNTTAQEAYVSTGLVLQAALGVQAEIFYAYDNANSALYNIATGELTAAGVAYQQTEQWLTGATEPSGYQLNGSVYTVQLEKNGESELIVWNSAGPSSYAAGSYTQYVTVEGQVEPVVNGEVTIGTVPILLVGYCDLKAGQIGAIYEAVLQRAPTATEVTASLALDSMTLDVGVIVSLVDSAEAISNVYPILQMFELALGYFPSAATLASMVQTGLSVPQLAAAFVASQAFANIYNGGTLLNPNAPVTAAIVEALYSEGLGHAPTPATLNGWLTSGLTIAQAFEEMVTSQSYFETTQSSIEGYLTAAAINEAGLTTINGSQATGDLTLGTATTPLTQPGLTVLGGSGALTVVASGAGDTITVANGANIITANGAGDTINLGVVSTGTSITSAQTIHASGAGDVITFATTAAEGTAVTWGGASTVDGGNSSTGIGAKDTINFGTNTGSGAETAVVTGDLAGATTSGGTSTSAIAMTTLGNVVDGHGDLVVFDNASTEVLAGTSPVNVSSANSLAHALDMAAAAAAASQSGGTIGAHTGVIDWFQYGGNTYMVEAINTTASAVAHAALAATDEIIKIVGLVSLDAASIQGHTLTL
jgi:polysaccharide biosynthesis protein PslG